MANGESSVSVATPGPLAAAREERDQELTSIREALRGLRYGSVNIIVQDGVIVQIDRTEKRRVRQKGARD